MAQNKTKLLEQLWGAQNEAYDLMCEYDSLPHYYGEHILYQAEGHAIDLIGEQPGITITDLAGIFKKTPSACSQIVRKLRDKGWVTQKRNAQNNRIYNLFLSEAGTSVYKEHLAFSDVCQKITFDLLDIFSPEELAHHIAVQKQINLAYQGDIQRSRARMMQPNHKEE